MGGHYGSIHIRTDDRDEVRIAVENLRHPQTQRFYIAPPIKGWVTVFPENHGQDHTVAEALVARLPKKTIIYCTVYDDDIFAYHFFENGKLSDAYNSCPEYFNDDDPPPRGGNASAFSNLLPAAKIPKLQKVLDEKRYIFEVERQDKFAELLGLPNTAAAYEYIKDNDVGELQQRSKFIHVPDLGLERNARRAQKAAAQKELKDLKAKGLLLVDETCAKSINRLFYKALTWAQNPAAPEVIASWFNPFDKDPANTTWKRFIGPSWTANDIAFPFAASLNGFQVSRSGKLLAICRNSNVELWDLPTNQLVAEHKFVDLVTSATFGIDDKYLFVTIRGNPKPELHRIALAKDLTNKAIVDDLIHFQGVIPHPDGRHLAAFDNSVLSVIEIESMRIVIQRWIRDPNSLFQQEAFKNVAAEMVKKITQFMTAEHVEIYRKQSARQNLGAEQIRTACFDADGAHLFCGVAAGLRGLVWKDILSGADMTPIEPAISVQGETRQSETRCGGQPRALTYAVTFDAAQRRVLFAGLEGKLSYYNLEDRRSGVLLTVPNSACFIALALSTDRSALIASAHRFDDNDRNKKHPQHFQIWNYQALCANSGIQF